MPFYEYECQACKFYTEIMQKITDAPLKRCPSCGERTLKKLVSAPVFRLKGSGWYETDFKSDKEGKRNLLGSDKDEPKAEVKSDSKPEAKAAGKADGKEAKAEPAKKPEKAAETASRSAPTRRRGVTAPVRSAAPRKSARGSAGKRGAKRRR